jgi:hypothetical protein
MASHFSSIGFPVAADEDIEALVEQTVENGTPVDAHRGRYLRWSPGAGAELWAGVDHGNNLRAFNPHVTGSSRVPIRATSLDTGDPAWFLEGSLHGWVVSEASPPGDSRSDVFPLMLNLPDFDRHYGRLTCPSLITVQVAAFAHELRCFVDDDAFYAATERPRVDAEPLRFNAESFIPSGLFHSPGDAPRAEAIVAGHIEVIEHRRNPASGQAFAYLRVRTYGPMVLDVVADPTILEGKPGIGGVVYGTFWLSGLIQAGGGTS